MLYKENYFIRGALEAGHEVLVIASNLTYESGRVCRVDPTQTRDDLDFRLVRFPHLKTLGHVIGDKLRIVAGLATTLEEFQPNLVYYNTPQIHGINHARRLRRLDPSIRIVCQFTTTFDNSSRSWPSRRILHGLIYLDSIWAALL